MIKTFCDIEIDSQSKEKCGNETTQKHEFLFNGQKVEVFISFGAPYEHICKSCLIKALKGE